MVGLRMGKKEGFNNTIKRQVHDVWVADKRDQQPRGCVSLDCNNYSALFLYTVLDHAWTFGRPRVYRVIYNKLRYKWRGPELDHLLDLVQPFKPLLLGAEDMFIMTAAELALWFMFAFEAVA